jgi:tetratricopeptide (TPR) repeat protein
LEVLVRAASPFRLLCSAALALAVIGLAAPVRSAPSPAEGELLAAYQRAWEERDVFALLRLVHPGALVFDDLLDDPSLDDLVEVVVQLEFLTSEPHATGRDSQRIVFRKRHEEVRRNGTVTRSVADIELIAQPAPGATLLITGHRVLPFARTGGREFRPDDPETWGEEHLPVEVALHRGHRLLRRGDCVGALPILEDLLAELSSGADLGLAAYQTGAHRFRAQGYYYAAVAHGRCGAKERAVPLAERALAENPDLVPALDFLAEEAVLAGRIDDATGLWSRAARLVPDHDAIADKLAFYQRAIQFYPNPDLLDLYLGTRGLAPSRAVTRLQRLARLSTGEPETRRRLAVVHLLARQPERAHEVLVANDFLFPHDLETQYLIARTYLAERRLEDATTLLARIWSRSPGFRDVDVLLVHAYESAERLSDAYGVLREALAMAPERPDLLFHSLGMAVELGRREEARAYLERAAQSRPPARFRRAIHEAMAKY